VLSTLKSIIEIILRLFNLFKWADYYVKVKKREKLIEVIEDKKSSEEDKLRAIRDLSR
jgi:hypothetical protein